uniref:Uncharacterized protein n=1 Tax=Chrysemys picta bellii TaxID=8478 RepID=A0A8C3I9J5_CHRPI
PPLGRPPPCPQRAARCGGRPSAQAAGAPRGVGARCRGWRGSASRSGAGAGEGGKPAVQPPGRRADARGSRSPHRPLPRAAPLRRLVALRRPGRGRRPAKPGAAAELGLALAGLPTSPAADGRLHLKSACPAVSPLMSFAKRPSSPGSPAAGAASPLIPARGRGRQPRGDPTGSAGRRERQPPPHPRLVHHAPLSPPQAKILNMMEDNKQLALRIDGAIQSASQEMTNLRAELTATNRRLAELGSSSATPSIMENNQHNAQALRKQF